MNTHLPHGDEAILNIRKIEDQILEKMIESEDLQKNVQEAAARLDGEKSRVAAEITGWQGSKCSSISLRAERSGLNFRVNGPCRKK